MQSVPGCFGQTLRGGRIHHKDSELHRNPCPQTIFQSFMDHAISGVFNSKLSLLSLLMNDATFNRKIELFFIYLTKGDTK